MYRRPGNVLWCGQPIWDFHLSLEGVGAVLGLEKQKLTEGKDLILERQSQKDQMRKFLKFVHDDNVYCKYYEVFYILFHTGLRISEFCGLTIKDIDLKNRIINIDHQLQRIGSMEYHIESTKTNAGTRKLQ